jgi:hypothetical protein
MLVLCPQLARRTAQQLFSQMVNAGIIEAW